MDNVQDQVTVAPQGQATPPAQTPTNAPSENSTGTVVAEAARGSETAAGQEGLILGKFKSNEDLAKAYQDLEAHNKKVEMDRAELEKLFTPTEPVSTPTPVSSGTPAAAQEENPLAEVVKALTPEFNKLLSPVIAKLEVDNMTRKYGDEFVASAKDVKAKITENPNLSMEDAYKLVAFDRLQKTTQEKQQARIAQAQEAAQKAQLETTQPSGQRGVSLAEAASNKNVPTKELFEALGPEFKSWTERL